MWLESIPMTPSSSLRPTGFAETILIATILLGILCVIAVVLRTWQRVRDKTFHVDDAVTWLGLVSQHMVLSEYFHNNNNNNNNNTDSQKTFSLVQYAVVAWGTTVGIGSPDSMGTIMQTSIIQATYWIEVTYTLAMGFSKASICSTLLRINKGTGHRKTAWTIWLIMIAVTASATGYFLYYATRCGPSQGCRDSSKTLFVLFFLWVGLYLLIDIMLVVLPLVIIRGLNMKKSLKVSLGVILAMGGVVGLACVLGIPAKFDNAGSSTDRGYKLGSIVLWSVVETGLSIIACCLPMIRKLLKSFDTDQSLIVPGRPVYNQPGSSGHSRQISHGTRHSLPRDSHLSPDQRTQGFVPLQLSGAVTASAITLSPGTQSTLSSNGQVQGHCPMPSTKSSGLDHDHQIVELA